MFDSEFPYALAIGMSADDYWNSDPHLFRSYLDAHKLRNEQKNQELWMQGIYIAEAIASVLSDKKKPHKYPDKPFDLYPKPKTPETERQKIIDYFTKLKERWDQSHGRSSTNSKD